jgi:hypothetical protein
VNLRFGRRHRLSEWAAFCGFAALSDLARLAAMIRVRHQD